MTARLGRTTEVLSGDYYTQLSTSTPHQIWSSAMVISPLLRGMMGLEVNALKIDRDVCAARPRRMERLRDSQRKGRIHAARLHLPP